MSAGPPSSYPPAPPPGAGAPRPARRGFFDAFKGLQWWEVFLSVLPLGLVVVGGLIGAVIGVLSMLANLAIARRVQSVALRALAMIGVVVAGFVLWVIIVGLLYAATHPSA